MTTIAQLRARLKRAQAEIGGEGRFSVTFHQQRGSGACSILHWVQPEGATAEECHEVGHGTIDECLVALDRYVAARRSAAPPAAGGRDRR